LDPDPWVRWLGSGSVGPLAGLDPDPWVRWLGSGFF
jgi:hypothetical protein